MFKYNEVIGNIFDYEGEYIIIGAAGVDLRGIEGVPAVIDKRYGLEKYFKKVMCGEHYCNPGIVLVHGAGKVGELIIHSEYDLRAAVEDLKEYCIMRERVRESSDLGKSVTKLAFPQLSLKNESWHDLLFDVFGDTDYEVLVVKEKEEVELEIKDGYWDVKQGKIEF